MARCDRFRAGLFVPFVLLAATLTAQDRPITGARLTLVEKNEAVLAVTLENRRDSPLVAWEIGVVPPGLGMPSVIHTKPRLDAPGDGAVAPGARHLVNIEVSGRVEGSTAVMRLALFADGYYEGQQVATDAFRKRQQQEAEQLRYWMAVLNQLPPGSDDDVRTFLKQHLVQRAADDTQWSSVVQNIRSLAVEVGQRPPGSLRSALDRRRTEAQEWLAVLDRPMTPLSLQRAGDVPSVGVTSSPATSGKLYGVVENLRDVPIEAVGFGEYATQDDRRLGFQTSDFCGVTGSAPGHGRIAPGEKREFGLSSMSIRKVDGTLSKVELRLVMFDDLSWEGVASERAAVLRGRERRADEFAYWIPALTEAATRTPENARAFLEAKRRERIAARALAGGARTDEVDQVLERISKTPSAFAAMATSMAANMERERVQLTRHQSR